VGAEREPITIDRLLVAYSERRKEIRTRLREFRDVWQTGSDARLWEEMVFCIFTAGASARMGLRSVEALRPLLQSGAHHEMTSALVAAGAFSKRATGLRHCDAKLSA
jgi:thermostable 8-oxoguanine DNA glycosylase